MAANYFLKLEPFDDYKGESMQKGHEDEIEILSFSWGVSQAGGYSYGSGGTSAKSNLQDLSVSFRICPASPKLMQTCASGKHLDKATLACYEAAGDEPKLYHKITLTDVVISSYQTGGSGDDKAIESMSVNFAKIEQEYHKQDDQGITKLAGSGNWNQQTAKADK